MHGKHVCYKSCCCCLPLGTCLPPQILCLGDPQVGAYMFCVSGWMSECECQNKEAQPVILVSIFVCIVMQTIFVNGGSADGGVTLVGNYNFCYSCPVQFPLLLFTCFLPLILVNCGCCSLPCSWAAYSDNKRIGTLGYSSSYGQYSPGGCCSQVPHGRCCAYYDLFGWEIAVQDKHLEVLFAQAALDAVTATNVGKSWLFANKLYKRT